MNDYSDHGIFGNHLIVDYGLEYGYLNGLLHKLKNCTLVKLT